MRIGETQKEEAAAALRTNFYLGFIILPFFKNKIKKKVKENKRKILFLLCASFKKIIII